jgi:hypothetical protein
VEFSPEAFKEHLGTRDDLGRLHTGYQKDELVMQLVERLWRESVEGLTKLEADALGSALGNPSGSRLKIRSSGTATA